ncbi:uncharacterized protein LOC127246034 [Andrographis paniculata]|uniref:uncharacterized protein LOC127246034 n=1 Tax=Andrographis paniculata TaxID=175694 RepID=UPI0021E77545|nr:uncharacterized protein LOC127246034 [Andrographis paniculata]
MINGEGAEEKSAVASPCDRESDGGDDLSHYSSCGGESEYERYCSASSAMGTPNSRSNSLKDADVWSLKGFKLGGENSAFKSFRAERLLSAYRESEKGNGFCHGNERAEGFAVSKVGINNGGVSGVGIDGDEHRNLSDESEADASSRSEHSEGEDSMFGCGSDDERRSGFYFGENAGFNGGNRRDKDRLAMDSAVAFGADDWDDFVQENALDSIVWDRNQDDVHSSIQRNRLAMNSEVAFSNDSVQENALDSIVWDDIGVGTSSLSAPSSVSCGHLIGKGNENELGSRLEACSRAGGVVESAEGDMNALSLSRAKDEVSDMDELAEYIGYNLDSDMFQRDKNRVGKEDTTKAVPVHCDAVLKNSDFLETSMVLEPLSESVDSNHHFARGKGKETQETRLAEDERLIALNVATKKNSDFKFDQIEDHFVPDKSRRFGLNGLYDEIVDDMQDILLDAGESMGSRFASRIHQPQFRRAPRDGGSSASTSGTEHTYNSMPQPRRIDWIEVVGARQKKGDVSFSERLVGVQRYTVYLMRVSNGTDHWEVERRYRDFNALYFRLKKLFTDHGWTLPSPWSAVEKESRKIFANASPGVVADRSVLIQECLQSVIDPKFLSGCHNALLDFLCPSEEAPDSPATRISAIQSPTANKDSQMDKFSTLGKTISLIVHIPAPKSMKQMLDEQHYRCAGCHKNFDDGRTRVREFVQALGWGKPRLCEYSGQLFCSSCHNNDYAVLPARVLHYWDFTRYPVSQLAKSFLDSISDKPMLCVSAVNPFLFSKVPTLQHVANIRNRIRAMVPYVRCPFRRSIYKGLGSRKYILESNDFFALRDLIDLSKGVFSALPAMVESVSRKILEHITEQCLVCYDSGIPCNARKDCDNPLSLIFPFQARECKKCRSCKSIFHKDCFKKIASCPCGARFKQEKVKQTVGEGAHCNSNQLEQTVAESDNGNGFLAGLFAKVMPGRSQAVRKQELRGSDNIILMGSLPNMTL